MSNLSKSETLDLLIKTHDITEDEGIRKMILEMRDIYKKKGIYNCSLLFEVKDKYHQKINTYYFNGDKKGHLLWQEYLNKMLVHRVSVQSQELIDQKDF